MSHLSLKVIQILTYSHGILLLKLLIFLKLVKLVDVAIGRSTTENPNKEVIFKLSFKTRLKEYSWSAGI